MFLKTAPINRKIWKNFTKEAQIINMKNKGAPISTDSTNVKKIIRKHCHLYISQFDNSHEIWGIS